MTRKKIARPDLAVPVELWGTIKGATDKLTWLERIDVAITAGMVQRSFLHVAVRIATQWLNKETGLTWRSAENLASDIGMAKSSVEGLLEDAVAAGLLIMVKRGQRGRGKRSTIYRPAVPDALKPDGPGFKPDLIPGGPGFKTSRKSRRKSRLEQPANPDFDPNIIPAHRDDLPEEVVPEDIIPVAAFGGANTARGDSSNTTRVVRESADRNSATSDAETLNQRAPEGALINHLAAQNQTPSRTETELGTAAANSADADAERAVVLDYGRKKLGRGGDALAARLLDAERALDALDAAQRVLDALDTAANEDDPHAHIENEIAVTLHIRATTR